MTALLMRTGSNQFPGTSTPARRRWLPLGVGLVVLAALLFVASSAPAVPLQKKLHKNQAALAKVNGQEADLSSAIKADNARVDDLIAELAAARQEAVKVRAQLDAEQAKLDRATKSLKAGKRRLIEMRVRLGRAEDNLRAELVSIYKSGDPNSADLVLGSASWSDLAARSEYLGAVQDYRDSVTTRVRELRNQAHDEVIRLGKVRNRVQASRDAIAAHEQQVEDMQASMQAQHDALIAAQDARQARIDKLQSQASQIQGNLGDITSKIQAQSAAAGASDLISVPTPSGSVAPPSAGETATLLPNGQAVAPAGAPPAVVAVIAAANSIADTPYIWGGGHGSFDSSGYDCSGSVSFALHGGGLLDSPLDSTGLETWGTDGPGNWISVYGNSGHAWAIIAGLRWDTAGHPDVSGPRWSTDLYAEDATAFVVRHWAGY